MKERAKLNPVVFGAIFRSTATKNSPLKDVSMSTPPVAHFTHQCLIVVVVVLVVVSVVALVLFALVLVGGYKA